MTEPTIYRSEVIATAANLKAEYDHAMQMLRDTTNERAIPQAEDHADGCYDRLAGFVDTFELHGTEYDPDREQEA